MSKFTNYGENRIADLLRGTAPSWPATWYLVAGSAGSDSGITPITGVGLSRAAVVASLANFKSTQGDALASTGSTKRTENSNAVSFGTATGSGSITHVGFYDASTGGNCWIWVPLRQALAFVTGAVSLPAGSIKLTLGVGGGATHKLVNALIDRIFRGQTFTMATTYGLAYFTTAPTDAGGGVEASGGGYTRISLVPSFMNLSSTQGDTSASTGSSGVVSNLDPLAHPDPTADQGDAVAVGTFNAASLGDLWFWRELEDPISVVADGDGLNYAVGEWKIVVA